MPLIGHTDQTHIPAIKAAVVRVQKSKPLTEATIRLRKWMIKHNVTAPQLARRTGFKPDTIYMLMAGHQRSYPSIAQAFAVEYVTDGYVPAWLWLDDPIVEKRIRQTMLAGVTHFEASVKAHVLKYNALKDPEGVIRSKARLLSRLFGVEWGEVERRVWADAKVRAKKDIANVDALMGVDDVED